MSFQLRPYKENEFERACQVRGLETSDAKARFKVRFDGTGKWIDHYLHLALVRDELLIGDIQLRHCDKTMPQGAGHIGIDISPEERGKGAGTAALNLAWEWAIANGFHRLEGSTSEENIAMQKAFKSAGWEYEGRLKKLFLQDGVAIDYLSFARTI
jgi:RimJ/RimL family protein N-acetyltransferase